MELLQLPDEILLHCLGFCSVSTLAAVARTCSQFHSYCNDESLWAALLQRDYPEQSTWVKPDDSSSSKHSYQMCFSVCFSKKLCWGFTLVSLQEAYSPLDMSESREWINVILDKPVVRAGSFHAIDVHVSESTATIVPDGFMVGLRDENSLLSGVPHPSFRSDKVDVWINTAGKFHWLTNRGSLSAFPQLNRCMFDMQRVGSDVGQIITLLVDWQNDADHIYLAAYLDHQFDSVTVYPIREVADRCSLKWDTLKLRLSVAKMGNGARVKISRSRLDEKTIATLKQHSSELRRSMRTK